MQDVRIIVYYPLVLKLSRFQIEDNILTLLIYKHKYEPLFMLQIYLILFYQPNKKD